MVKTYTPAGISNAERTNAPADDKAVLRELGDNANIMKKLGELAGADPRIASLKAQILGTSPQTEDPARAISDTITALTNISVVGAQFIDMEGRQSALAVRDNLLRISNELQQNKRKRLR